MNAKLSVSGPLGIATKDTATIVRMARFLAQPENMPSMMRRYAFEIRLSRNLNARLSKRAALVVDFKPDFANGHVETSVYLDLTDRRIPASFPSNSAVLRLYPLLSDLLGKRDLTLGEAADALERTEILVHLCNAQMMVDLYATQHPHLYPE